MHRDVKPEHVIVLDDGSVRLSGFRIASLLRVEAAPAVQGTLAYMAPEQTGRMNRPVDKRADLYALGVLLYELLTGRRPFEGTDPLEWIHAHIAQVPTPPDKVDEDRILQVLSNLVGNAALHGAPDSPVRLLIDGRSQDEVVVSVWNAGAIAPELVAVMFEPFRGGATGGSKGLGLGLYISQQIIHAHRGTLTVQSSPEEGTLCEMRLPRQQRAGGGVVGA